jgi:hypothetical protein
MSRVLGNLTGSQSQNNRAGISADVGRQMICEMCQRKRNLFRVQLKDREIMACNSCITDNLLTGWSK